MTNQSQNDLNIKEAELLKESGNLRFNEHLFQDSIDFYTKAIDKIGLENTKVSVYLCNRSLAQIKLENYGCALIDSELAITADPSFPKSYYRKSTCLFALGKLDESIKTLDRIVKYLKLTTHSDVNKRIKYLKQLKKEREFLDCLQYEDEADLCKETDLVIEQGYTGPVIENDSILDDEFIRNLLEFLKCQKKLHKKSLWILIKRAKEVLDKEENIVAVQVNQIDVKQLTVCGDIHGQFYDFLNILNLNGFPTSEKPYLFNGDFVDRGSFSVECMIALLAFKVSNSKCIYLNRGNHENPDLNKMYGFEGEVLAKYCSLTFSLFKNLFYSLPLAHLVNQKVLILHGGLFEKEGVKLDDIQKIQRRIAIPSTGLMCDMLWADPSPVNGRQKSKRGVSIEFGPDVSHKFLHDNQLGLFNRFAYSFTSSQGSWLRSRTGQ
jgi:serine/threonine-protein phosphatase 5